MEEGGFVNLLALDSSLMSILQNIQTQFLKNDEFYIQEYEHGKYMIIATTFDKLLNYISSESSARDVNDILDHIVFTYSYFTDVSTFLSKIIEKFCSMLKENNVRQLKPSQKQDPKMTQSEIINKKQQLQLLNLLKRWMRYNATIFREDSTFEVILNENLQKMTELSSEASSFAEGLRDTYNSAVKNKRIPTRLNYASSLEDTNSLYNFNDSSCKIEDVAQQMTLIEFDFFRNIEGPKELLHKHYTHPDTSPALHFWINQSIRITWWVVKGILQHTESKMRGSTITRFIDVAQELHRLKNFNGMIQVVTGLNHGAIKRLKQSWKYVSNRHITKLEELTEYANSSNNFNTYRRLLRHVLPPFIPFYAVIQRDLTFIEESSNTLGDSNHVVNFAKMSLLGNIMKAFQKAQTAAYVYASKGALLQYLRDQLAVETPDEQTLNNLSKTLEPVVIPSISRTKKFDKSCATCAELEEKRSIIHSLKKDLSEAKAREASLREHLEKISTSSTAVTSENRSTHTHSHNHGHSHATVAGGVGFGCQQQGNSGISPAPLKKLSSRGVSTSVLTPYDAQQYHSHSSVPSPLLPNFSNSSSSKPLLHSQAPSQLNSYSPTFALSSQVESSPRSVAAVREKITTQQQLRMLLELRSSLRMVAQASSCLSSLSPNDTKNARLTFETTVNSASTSIEKLLVSFNEENSV
eukprot:TRINITY_DN10552_c0_g1_i1.p1 TRINITY_DN10552_c0_g1~~TRINITY_DN10552_c0_g1_i1.p1  ORF type:complete len:727 (+),score=133.30 TRINITY_DN10552_c0_g1_i1:102-2183(+)